MIEVGWGKDRGGALSYLFGGTTGFTRFELLIHFSQRCFDRIWRRLQRRGLRTHMTVVVPTPAAVAAVAASPYPE